MSNPWIDAHDAWYRRATPAERAAFDASRACPARKVFAARQFPTRAAWARFLTLECALDEVIVGTPLPERHEVVGKFRVYFALQSREAALAGFARCTCGTCATISADVVRRVVTYTDGVATERHLCSECAASLARDPMHGIATITPAPIDD